MRSWGLYGAVLIILGSACMFMGAYTLVMTGMQSLTFLPHAVGKGMAIFSGACATIMLLILVLDDDVRYRREIRSRDRDHREGT